MKDKFNRRANRLERNVLYGTNASGEVLPPGTPVYIESNPRGIMRFGKAEALDPNKMPSIGVTTKTMKIGEEAEIVIGGFAEVSIPGITGVSVGDSLYVGATGGVSLTPASGGNPQIISSVLSVSAPGVVSSFIVSYGGSGSSSGGSTLEGLSDTPSGYGDAGQVLISDGVSGFYYGEGGLWDSVAGTSTNITYEDGVVGIKDSAVTYPTSGPLFDKINDYPAISGQGSLSADVGLHVHQKSILVTSNDPSSRVPVLRGENSFSTTLTNFEIGMVGNGMYMKSNKYRLYSVDHSDYFLEYKSPTSNYQSTDPITIGQAEPSNVSGTLGGIYLPGGLGKQNYAIRMGGPIQFYNASYTFPWDAMTYDGLALDGGVAIGARQSGSFAYFKSSDQNTAASYGYLGINVNNPTVSGPALEVSSGAGRFNNGLHVGDVTTTGYAFPTADGTASQFLQTDGAGNLSFADVVQLWAEDGLGIKYTTTGGSVSILESTRPYSGAVITSLFGSQQSQPGGSRAGRKLLHLHEGQLIFSTTDNTAVSHIEMSNEQHSAAVGGAIGTSTHNMRIHGYHALEFTHGSTFSGAQSIVSMDIPSTSANVGNILIGAIDSPLGGISLPSFGPATVDTTNYSISMGGRIIFKNHSNIEWDAITQGPGTYASAGVSLSSSNSHDILVAVSSDSNTPGSYGYVGINSYSPSVSGPAFEVSSSYAKLNSGLTVGGTVGTNWYTASVTGKLRLTTNGAGNGSVVIAGNNPGGSNTGTSVYIGAHNVASGTGQANSSVVIGTNTAGGTGAYHESVIIGDGALAANSAGTRTSVLVGYSAGGGGLQGYNAVGIGFRALMNATGVNNVGVGQRAGMVGGGNVTFVGNAAGDGATGVNNVGIGAETIRNAAGSYNTAIGYGAGSALTSGANNLFVGYRAGSQATTASNNLIFGKNAGYNVVNDANIFIGEEAGYSQTGSGYKIFIGRSAGRTAAGGPGIAIGQFAAQNSTVDDSESVVIGENATFTGIRSVTLGAGASAGANGVAIGRASSVTQDNSIAIGSGASVTGTGATYTIAIGTAAQGLTRGIYIGGFAGQNATGSGNVQIGEQPTRMGASNTIIGHNAGAQTQNYATEVFDQNVVIGRSAAELAQGQTDNNVIIGHQAAYSADGPLTGNVIIGKSALSGSTTTAEASNNVIIGTEAAGTSIGSSNIFIGYQAAQSETGSNKLYISNSNTTTPLIYGEFDNNIVQIHNTSTGRMGFYPSGGPSGHNAVMQIADADYFGHTLSGSVNGYGLAIVHRSTIAAPTGGAYKLKGVIIGNDFDLARNPGEYAYGGIVIANGLTSDVTTGNSALPGIAIGTSLDFTGYSNNAQSVVIGGGRPSNAAYGGVAIAGNQTIRPLGNGVSIQAQSGGGSVSGIAIMGRAAGYNIAIGEDCNLNGTGSSPGTFIGRFAAKENSGQGCTAVGTGALQWVSGFGNTVFGAAALSGSTSVRSGQHNTVVGYQTLTSNVSASSNTAVGYKAGYSVTSGGSNTLIGHQAGYSYNTAVNNVLIGKDAGYGLVSSSNNVYIGYESGSAANNAVGSRVAIGYRAAKNATGTGSLVAIGYNAGEGADGNNQVFVGYESGLSFTGPQSVGIGFNTLKYATSAATNSVGIGYEALRGSSGTPMSGAGNVAIGSSAADSVTTGDANTVIGTSAGTQLGTGSQNVLIGNFAGSTMTTGFDNLAMGSFAMDGATAMTGSYNVALGEFAMRYVATGTNNIFLGYKSGLDATAAYIPSEITNSSNYQFLVQDGTRRPLIHGDLDTIDQQNGIGFVRMQNPQKTFYYGSGACDQSEMYYLSGAGTYAKASASAAGAAAEGFLLFTMGTDFGDGLIAWGEVDYTITGNAGDKVYLSTTSGALTTTAPSGSGNIVRVVGYVTYSNRVFLVPSTDYVEIA